MSGSHKHIPLLLNAAQVAQMLGGVDVESVKAMMQSDIIKSEKRTLLLKQKSVEYLTTPLAVVDYIASCFGYTKEEARKYYTLNSLFKDEQ